MDAIQDPDGFIRLLAHIPSEILILIFDSVPKPQLKVLRSKCRKFEPIASDILFRTISLAPRKRQLRVLAHVANHPVLRLKVRHLSYDLSRYSDIPPDELHRPKFDTRLFREFGLVNPNQADIVNSWKHLHNLLQDENIIIQSNNEGRMLTRYLPCLERLQELSISYKYTGPYRYSAVPPLLPASRFESFNKFESDTHQIVGDSLLFLFEAIQEARFPIRIFNYEYNYHFSLFFPFPMDHLTHYHSSVKTLTTLTLSLDRVLITDHLFRPVSDFIYSGLPAVLQSATGLQHLSIIKAGNCGVLVPQKPRYLFYFEPRDDDQTQPRSTAVDSPQILHWPHLKSIELRQTVCAAEELIDILTAQRHSLQEVVLTQVILSKGRWEDVATCLASLHHLKRLTLRNLMYFNHARAGISTGFAPMICRPLISSMYNDKRMGSPGSEEDLEAMLLRGEYIQGSVKTVLNCPATTDGDRQAEPVKAEYFGVGLCEFDPRLAFFIYPLPPTLSYEPYLQIRYNLYGLMSKPIVMLVGNNLRFHCGTGELSEQDRLLLPKAREGADADGRSMYDLYVTYNILTRTAKIAWSFEDLVRP